tara:strand:+ start:151 stop:699 length:549 start_codon:yes stop_codon:yes gene_type:complete
MAQGNEFATSANVVDGEAAGGWWTETYTTEQYPLGTTRIQTDVQAESGVAITVTDATWNKLTGDREWVFVQAAEEVTAGNLCEWDVASAYSVEPADTDGLNAGLAAGVADNTIAASSYGWIVKRGTCVVKAGGSVVAGSPLAADGTDGQVDQGGTKGDTVGFALEEDGAVASGHAQAYISIP